MVSNNELQRYTLLASYFLPDGILDWFDLVRMKETDNDKPTHEQDVFTPRYFTSTLMSATIVRARILALSPTASLSRVSFTTILSAAARWCCMYGVTVTLTQLAATSFSTVTHWPLKVPACP